MNGNAPHRVVVLGGGYAGTIAAIRLAGRARGSAQVTLVDPTASLVQRLRLHQVAAGQEVAAPSLRSLAGRRPVDVLPAWATAIDRDRSRVELSSAGGPRELPYDTLILAMGSTVDLASVPGVAEHAHSVADVQAALRLRDAFRAAPAGAVVAVVGGGMTGIEVAAELAAARPDVRVRLVTSGALGGWLSDPGREYLGRALDRLGVAAVDGVRARALDADRMLLDRGELEFDLAVWCGGFVAQPLAREAGLPVDGAGRVLVDRTMRSLVDERVLAAGDAAAVPGPAGLALRMTCQAGMPAGAHAADTVLAALRGRDPEPLDFGYIHQPLSLGRRDGLIQWVERDDSLKQKVLTGRAAAAYKEIVSRSAIVGIRMERRLPGFTRWRSGEGHAAPRADAATEGSRASAA